MNKIKRQFFGSFLISFFLPKGNINIDSKLRNALNSFK